jgi:hypothetical protein
VTVVHSESQFVLFVSRIPDTDWISAVSFVRI